jgi:predicted 3-demethylubiquinone-9 3-methyltransferase (glyoxalase superfamily)
LLPIERVGERLKLLEAEPTDLGAAYRAFQAMMGMTKIDIASIEAALLSD